MNSTNNNSSSGSGTVIALAVGVILGGFIVYVIMQNRQPQTTMLATQPAYVPQYVSVAVPSLQPSTPQVQQAQGLQSQPAPPPIPSLQNEEEWEVYKDDKGRLKRISVHRKVSPLVR